MIALRSFRSGGPRGALGSGRARWSLQLQSGEIDEYLPLGARFTQGKGSVLRLAQHYRPSVTAESDSEHDDEYGSEDMPCGV